MIGMMGWMIEWRFVAVRLDLKKVWNLAVVPWISVPGFLSSMDVAVLRRRHCLEGTRYQGL